MRQQTCLHPCKLNISANNTVYAMSKFKGNGSKWLTEGLFLETTQSNDNVLYSMQPWDKELDGKIIPSIHRLYVDMEDVSEWEFGNKYFDGYQHWLVIREKPFFAEAYKRMKEELNAKLRGKALKVMLAQVAEGTASQATLKYLADNDYLPKSAVGKPRRGKKKEGSVVSLVKSDLDRIKN